MKWQAEIIAWPVRNGGPYVGKEVWEAPSEYEFLRLLKDSLKTRRYKCKVVSWEELENA